MSAKQYELPRYTTKQDRDFLKLQYDAKKNRQRKDPKTVEKSEFTTLEEAINKNIQNFEQKKKKQPKKTAEIEQEEIDYILDSVPFIKELFSSNNEDISCEEINNDSKVFKVKSVKKNNTIFQKYLYDVENVHNMDTLSAVLEKETIDDIYTCSKCKNPMKIDGSQSIMVCEKCGHSENYIESYTFHEQNDSMAYKRSNHLVECLNSLQGKEGTTVPQEVIDAVRAEFKKNRISSSNEIKPTKVKQFLKKLGYSAYYDNIYSITNRITGLPTLKLSASLEKKFKDMFNEIQEPFERHKPPERKNFLSYNYVLYKFSELLGEDELLPYFPLLKCRQNLHAQDVIWQKICADLRWEYIPTT